MVSSGLLKNSYWTLLDLGIYPVLMIVSTPVFINELGPAQYGLWMLLSNITQLMNALNMGVGDSTVRFVSKHRARDESHLVQHAVSRNFSLSILLSIVVMIAGIILAQLITTFGWFDIDTARIPHAGLLITMACALAGFKFLEAVLLSVFKGLQRFDISARLSILSRNLPVVAALVLLQLNGGLLWIIGASCAISALCILVQLRTVKLRTGIIPRLSVRFSDIADAARSNTWYWLQSVIALLGYLSDKFLVAWLTSLETLGYYSIASLIAIQVHNALLAFGAFIFPKVSHGLETQADLRPIYFLSRACIAVPGWIILTVLWLLGPYILPMWLGDTTYHNAAAFIDLYIAFEAIILLIIVPYHFLNGTDHVRLNTWFELALRSSHLALMIACYFIFGATGLIWGLIIATLFNLPFQLYLFEQTIFGLGTLKSVFPVIPGVLLASAMVGPATASGPLFILFLIGTVLIYIAPVLKQIRKWKPAVS